LSSQDQNIMKLMKATENAAVDTSQAITRSFMVL
jgi:hypothetical protein